MTATFDHFVVIFFDRYDEDSVSFVLGPFDNLQDAQAATKRAIEKTDSGYRRYSIQECRSLRQIPEWERRA